MLLIGDIGGTRARLALVAPERGLAEPVAEVTRPSGRYDGLEQLVRDFLGPASPAVDRAVFAVAGPVVEGRAVLTNLGWELEEERLREALGVDSVRLLNDVLATAYAIPHLGPDALHTLQHGSPDRQGAIAVVAPGTGLGEAFLVRGGASYGAHPSEGGHADFAPTDAFQIELLRWMLARSEHVSYECVCSGRALPDLYAFLRGRGLASEEEWLTARLAEAEDATPVIMDAALDRHARSPLCVAAVKLFAAILAAEAGNAALRVLATGGVYLSGGLPPRLLPVLEREAFRTAFRRKGRLSGLLARVPLHVVVEPKAALLGAFHYGTAES